MKYTKAAIENYSFFEWESSGNRESLNYAPDLKVDQEFTSKVK